MFRQTLFAAAALLAAAAPAWAQEIRYITDDITLAVRDDARNDAEVIGQVSSGEAVTLVQSLGAQSYSKIRLSSGLQGWIPSRHLDKLPAAADRLDGLKNELKAATDRAAALQQQLDAARQQLEAAKPALELARENDTLKAAMAEYQREREQLVKRYDATRAQRKTMLTGAALLAGGALLGLVLPRLFGRRRRYGEL